MNADSIITERRAGGVVPRRPSRARPFTGRAGAGRRAWRAALLLLAGLTGGCTLVARPEPPVPRPAPAPADPASGIPDAPPGGWIEEGVASWYGPGFHGRQTASGERYDMEAATAAHPSLPFGTVVVVHNLDTGRQVRLRINDRGPFVDDRIIDVSRHAARELGMLGPGIARVRIGIVDHPEPQRCWEVQAGSFVSASNADALRRRLESGGHAARVVSGSDGYHRVIAGPFRDRDEATERADELGGLLLGC